MPSNSYPIIAREGWPTLILLAVIALIAKLTLGLVAGGILLVLMLLVMILLRDPPRAVPAIPLGVVSPLHGRVIAVDHLTDIWLKRSSIRLRLRMSPLNIFSLRSPVEGKIMDQRSGRDPDNPDIRQYAFWIKTDEGDDVIMSIRMNWWPKRLKLYVQCGERLGQGQRCGYLYFGGEVDIWLPEQFRVDVIHGQTVRAGSMLLGKLVHRKSSEAAAS
ncbi:MAG: phosphatidylserine decarboxylase [Gammaproteobacteria bacterium]